MIFLSCLLTICINYHKPIKDDKNLISYIYKDQQECLDKNKGKNELPNDDTKYLCANILYPSTIHKIDPIDAIVVPIHIETEGDKVMKKANDYYKNHINEYYLLELQAIKEEENRRKEEKSRKEYMNNQPNGTLSDCVNRNSKNIDDWALSHSNIGDSNDYNRRRNEAYKDITRNCMSNGYWNGFPYSR